MFINIIIFYSIEYKSMSLVTVTYLIFEAFEILFSNSFTDFYSCQVVSSSEIRKNKTESFDNCAYTMAVVLKVHFISGK